MNGTLDEAAELAQCSSIPRPMEAAGAVDAQNAPTAPWKSLRDSHKRPPPSMFFEGLKTKNGPALARG
jgi:hypothetical protein